MEQLAVTNCPKCGKIMLRGHVAMCIDCLDDIQAQLQKCLHYLRKDEEASIDALSEATGVSVKQIQEFIRMQHLSPRFYPNLFYSCRMCKGNTKAGSICEKCQKTLSRMR
jgi:hypothetical protein